MFDLMGTLSLAKERLVRADESHAGASASFQAFLLQNRRSSPPAKRNRSFFQAQHDAPGEMPFSRKHNTRKRFP